MADQQKQEGAAKLFTQADLAELLKVALAEARKPYIDEELAARRARQRENLIAERAAAQASLEAGQNACSHLRQNNTSRIAWNSYWMAALNTYYTIGFCQYCNKQFMPGVTKDYEHFSRIPTGQQGLIGY